MCDGVCCVLWMVICICMRSDLRVPLRPLTAPIQPLSHFLTSVHAMGCHMRVSLVQLPLLSIVLHRFSLVASLRKLCRAHRCVPSSSLFGKPDPSSILTHHVLTTRYTLVSGPTSASRGCRWAKITHEGKGEAKGGGGCETLDGFCWARRRGASFAPAAFMAIPPGRERISLARSAVGGWHGSSCRSLGCSLLSD